MPRRRSLRGPALAVLALALLLPVAAPEETEAARPRDLARGLLRFDPLAGGAPEPGTQVAADATERFIVQFDGPIGKSAHARLAALPHLLHDYIPTDGLLLTLDLPAREAIAAWHDVRAVVPYHPGFKVSPRLPSSGSIDATLLLHRDADLARSLEDLRVAGARVRAHATTALDHVVDAVLDARLVATVARMEAVAWIEPALDVGGLDNEVASATTQGGAAGRWPVHEHGVDGRSQIVSVCDTGVPTRAAGLTSPVLTPNLLLTQHEMFEDGMTPIEYNRHLARLPLPLADHRKVALYYSPQEGGNRGDATDAHGHGTATAATLAGDAAPHGARSGHDGAAPAARLAVCDIHAEPMLHILNDYANYWDPAYAAGARISSNSWGATPTDAYTVPARQHDAYVWGRPDFLIVRSMGNSGDDGLMRPEAAAKSVLAVGATLNDGAADAVSGTSSQGPTADGRIKPDLVAPGSCLWTATLAGPVSYDCLSGTSLATPMAAGGAALVRDYFERGFHPDGPRSPSAALVRAVLFASGREVADDRGASGFPNQVQGWGRATLQDVLDFGGTGPRLTVIDEVNGLSTGETYQIPITVGVGSSLRVQLAWSDAPGAAGASPALVNDLDLRLVGPGGRVRTGNAGDAPSGRSAPDRVNVAEAIRLEDAAPGTYSIEVRGASAPMGPQPFVLAIVAANA